MQIQVNEWGKSQEIRTLKEVLKSTGISTKEVLDVTVLNEPITLVEVFQHKTLEERVAEYDGDLVLDGEYDWGEPVGNEVWCTYGCPHKIQRDNIQFEKLALLDLTIREYIKRQITTFRGD